MVKVWIIGGSGLDNPKLLQNYREVEVETPYGKPSSSLTIGKLNGVDVVIIARHGRKHQYPPTAVNNRANIYALKQENITHIISTTACGSLREEIGRGDFVIIDQFIDFTRHRKISFYDMFEDEAKHTPMAEPFSKELRELLINTSKELGFKTHEKGTVVTIEGPRFSTKAESHMFRSWGADVINMSITPEAILANELKIPYASIAMSTDFDCWKSDAESVTWEEILKVFNLNSEKVKQLLISVIPRIAGKHEHIKNKIRTIPDWPKQGVMFRDITTLLKDPKALKEVISRFKNEFENKNISKVVGIESRGFIFGSILAHELGVAFIPARKPGKLPAPATREEYELEYGKDAIEIHNDAIEKGDNVLIVDDLVATAGTMLAAAKLVEKLGGRVAGIAYVIDLPELKGKEKLKDYNVFNLIEFEGG